MKKHILLLLVALLSLTASAEYRLGTINVTLPGGTTSAVARIDDANRLVVLGNGYTMASRIRWRSVPLPSVCAMD